MKNTIGTLMIFAVVGIGVGVGAYAMKPPVAEPWEHGWKTRSIVATRYTNPTIGYNIGFTFPGHEYESDRSELLTFIAEHHGNVYEGGGYPGAPLFTRFSDVTDRVTADAKLQTFLPQFETFVSKLW